MDWNGLYVPIKHLGAKAYVQTKHFAAKAYDTFNEGMVSLTKSKPEVAWMQSKLGLFDVKICRNSMLVAVDSHCWIRIRIKQ